MPRPLVGFVPWLVAVVLVALPAPASAQFGGLGPRVLPDPALASAALLATVDVLGEATPEELRLKVGDLVLLAAGAGPVAGRLDFTLQGDAMERLAVVHRVTPLAFPGQFAGQGEVQPLLRATRPGKTTLAITFERPGSTWKTTRTFTILVTTERAPTPGYGAGGGGGGFGPEPTATPAPAPKP
jgi:hypothetical protein